MGTHDLQAQPVELVDGRTLVVRSTRPDDKPLLLDIFRGLGPESRYRRFLAPITTLGRAELAYFTEVDHHDHEALLAIDAATAEAVGVARFIRALDDPRTAELAVTVVDRWQGSGVGTALLALLIDRAHEEGFVRFIGSVLAGNRPMLELLREFTEPEVAGPELGVVEFTADLPRERLGDHLPVLLRLAARRELHVAATGEERGEIVGDVTVT